MSDIIKHEEDFWHQNSALLFEDPLPTDETLPECSALSNVPVAARRSPRSPSAPKPGEVDEEETTSEPPDVIPDHRYHWPTPEHREKNGDGDTPKRPQPPSLR